MKTPRWLFCIGAVFFLGACVKGHQNSPDESHACADAGGDWRQVCVAQEYRCVLPYRDGGKACSDSSECEGECLVDVTTKCTGIGNCVAPEIPKPGEQVMGMCQLDDDPCGSFVIVRDGRAQPTTHRD